MANAGDGVQESGWAGARGQKQVPERYAQLQAALDQARSASADGRGGHAAAQDQTRAEQGWIILASGALHRHRQGRARAMLRGMFSDGKKQRQERKKDAAELEEARQKQLETVYGCWSLLSAGLLRNHRRTVGKVTLRNALRKATPTMQHTSTGADQAQVSTPQEVPWRPPGRSGPPWRHSRSPRGKKEAEEATPKARSVSPRLQMGRRVDGGEGENSPVVQEEETGRSRHKWKLRKPTDSEPRPPDPESDDVEGTPTSRRLPRMVRSADRSDDGERRPADPSSTFAGSSPRMMKLPRSDADSASDDVSQLPATGASEELPERYARFAPKDPRLLRQEGVAEDSARADEQPADASASSTDADPVASRSARKKEPDSTKAANALKARSESPRLQTSRVDGSPAELQEEATGRSRPGKKATSPAAGAEAAEDPALTRDSARSSARSHSPRGPSSPTSRRQGKRADEQPADAAASSTDADPDASRSTRKKEPESAKAANTLKARSESPRLQTSRVDGSPAELQEGATGRSRPGKKATSPSSRSPAAGEEAAEDPALTRDSERSSARSHSPRGQSSPTSRQGKRPDATGLSASQAAASARADEQPADASASSTDADANASRSAQKTESDSSKAASALKARVDGSPAELQEEATRRSRPGKKATSPSSRSPAAGAEAAEDPALTRDSERSSARSHSPRGQSSPTPRRQGKRPDAIGVSTSQEASARADARPADASASSADVDAGDSRSARRKREPDPVNAANTLEDRRPAAGAEAAEDSEELPRDSGRTARSHSPKGRSSPTSRRQGKRQADTGIVASQEAASGRADSQPADAAASSADTDADASRPDVPGGSLDTWPTRDSSTAANFEDHSDVQRTEPDKMSSLQRAKPTSRAQSGPKENLGGRDEGTRDKSATWSFKKGGEASKTGSKEPSRSTSPTTEKQQRGEAPSVKAPAASVSEGTPPQSPRAQSPKWDFKKGDDPKKKSQQDPARSTTAKPDRQQAAEGSGSSSTAKPRADEASTPPQSPRGQSATWSFKKGGEASKTGSKEPSRSTSPTTEKQQRGEAPSVKAPAASVSEGTPPQSPRETSSKWSFRAAARAASRSASPGKEPGDRSRSAAGKWSKYVALQRSRSASNEDSAREPASRDKKWNFAERVLRSRSPSAGAEERSHRRSTLLDACIGEAGDSLAPKLGTDAPLNADSLAQYFQAKRDAERTAQAPAAHTTQEELERVPRFGSEASSEEGPPGSLPLQLLQAELKTMKVLDLRDRAATYGCAEETVRAALDGPTPKSALTELILDVARDASDALMEMSWTELKQHAEEMGITEAQLASAEEGKNPKVSLIMAIFGSGSDQGVQSPGKLATGLEVSFDVGHGNAQIVPTEAYGLRLGRKDLVQEPGPHQLGPGAFGMVWWYLNAEEEERPEDVMQSPAVAEEARKALPPVPSSGRPPPEVKFEDAASAPRHLLPWVALHAPLKQGHRIKLAAQAVVSAGEETAGAQELDAVGEVSLSQALHLVHWCWAHPHAEMAASSLVPMLFLGNEGKVELDWALMLLSLHMWRRASATADRKEFLVDNELLQAPAPGLTYFFSKNLGDVDTGKTAMWGQVVVGKRQGQWVKVGHCCYLPTSLNGVQVLREDFDPSEVSGVRARGRSALAAQVNPALSAGHDDIADLTKDLKKAVQRSVAQRRDLDAAMCGQAEAHMERRRAMEASLQDTQLELEAAAERAALEAGLLAGSAAAAAGNRGDVLQELAGASVARKAAENRKRWLKEELKAVEAQRPPPAAVTAPLLEMRREVQQLRAQLHAAEAEMPTAEDLDATEQAPPEMVRKAAEIAARAAALKRSEQAVDAKRAEVRAATEEASLYEREAIARRAECDQLSKQIQDLKAEERTAAARSRELDREVHGLASGYERYKRLCFVYSAALLRAPNLGQQLQEDTKPKRGLDALIQALASRYGWPEVAFLHIDRRGAGRLGATELRMGLLLGARIDFPAVTGLTAEALLSAMDSRGAGFVTAQDLAACRPGIWQEFGATAILAMEKLRALPWEAAGGRTQAFQEAAQDGRLHWTGFEGLLCSRLRGLPKPEAQQVFAGMAESDATGTLSVSRATWEKATEEVPSLDAKLT